MGCTSEDSLLECDAGTEVDVQVGVTVGAGVAAVPLEYTLDEEVNGVFSWLDG